MEQGATDPASVDAGTAMFAVRWNAPGASAARHRHAPRAVRKADAPTGRTATNLVPRGSQDRHGSRMLTPRAMRPYPRPQRARFGARSGPRRRRSARTIDRRPSGALPRRPRSANERARRRRQARGRGQALRRTWSRSTTSTSRSRTASSSASSAPRAAARPRPCG